MLPLWVAKGWVKIEVHLEHCLSPKIAAVAAVATDFQNSSPRTQDIKFQPPKYSVLNGECVLYTQTRMSFFSPVHW
jgi:hypothetical protein